MSEHHEWAIRLGAGATQILTGTSAIAAATSVNGVKTGLDAGNGVDWWGISCDPGVTCEVFDSAVSLDKVTAPAGNSAHLRLERAVPVKGPLKATVVGGAATVYVEAR